MKKNILFLLLPVLFATLNAQTGKRIYPLDDTYIFSNGGNENAVIRHLEDPNRIRTYTHQSDERWTYKSYLKFDLSSIHNDPDSIYSVVFKIVGKENQGAFEHKISLYSLESNDWNEDDLTYNSRNKVGTAVKIITLTQTLGNTADKWLDFDITQAVKAYKAAGKNTISLLLSEDTNVRNPVSNTGSIINFYSKEAGDATAPRLAVEAEENSIEEGGDEGGEDPDLPRLDLFLCIGQSNMAGRGPIDNAKDDRLAIDHCYLFNSNFKFELATNPMNQYSNIRKTLNEQQISPSYGFAKYLSEHQPDITTGMIVNARGGSAMDEWLPGADLYTKTVSRMKKALPYGELKAIIWHQGESNTSSTDTYLAKLNQMVTSMRNEFSAPDAYFLAGELIHSWSPATAFNRMIRTISDVISNSDWVSAEGLTPRSSGDVHFDRQSNISLGERYAQKVIDRLYSNTAIETIENKQVIINESSQLQIFDLCGRKVSSLSKGVFIVYLQTQNSVWKQKIIIN